MGPATTQSTAAANTATTGGTAQHTANEHDGHTITIPLDSVAHAAQKAVAVPVAAAQRILPAKGGLPLYVGLGALALAGVLEWPVAAGIGIGYAVLRRGGALPPPSAQQAPAHPVTIDERATMKSDADSSP
ncbi:hypothetical protein AB0L59_08795 [Streptomyces sp. NPDC052109]|uniref:hypothetical protein n=1 Tax=Streptomyces sp. NPDC052109 TaxID=3155527 RepID=UPI003430484C